MVLEFISIALPRLHAVAPATLALKAIPEGKR